VVLRRGESLEDVCVEHKPILTLGGSAS
jgi:hypothetical protein